MTPCSPASRSSVGCARSTWSGTQQGELFGLPATSKPFSMNVIDIVRFEGDTVVEHWGVSDVAGMMQQVGLAS